MANKETPNQLNSFTKGMLKDPNDTFIGEGQWTHARNLVNNSHDGQVGVVGNEPSNLFCVNLPYTLIGCISLDENRWAIFTTNDVNSEIGIFNELTCTYTTLVNDDCLSFNTKHLITGASRRTFDCSEKIYWSDGNNPDRVMDINNIPWKQVCVDDNNVSISNPPGIWPAGSPTGCVTCTDTTQLNCEQLRLAPLLNTPCLRVEKGSGSGTLQNGTYQVAIAYMINQIKVTDYLMVSNPVSIWSHSGVGGAIKLSVSNTDPDFTEMEVVVISIVNSQTVAKQLGVYSTRQSTIYIDSIDPTLVNIPISNIPLITPAIDKSDGIFPLNNYLLRVGPYTKPDFNYQPQANKIISKWNSVEYPEDYYHKAGSNVGYMRDEVYSFFIRWIYNTGDRSASYHIPGRPINYSGINDTNWQTKNTATITAFPNLLQLDGGILVKTGYMGYWQSTEKYPDDNPVVWNQPNSTGNGSFDLCGKNIRHHKFPDNALDNHFTNGGGKIRVLGVSFEGITAPKDINGNIIDSIVGYEILRGSREGYKSVIAKGMVNNMKIYNIIDAKTSNPTGQQVLMQNYPYNDISTIDPFYESAVGMTALTNYASFHSPDTTFQNPYIGDFNLRIYGFVHGTMSGCYNAPYKHPEFKIVGQRGADLANIIAGISAAAKIAALILGDEPLTIAATNDMPIKTVFGMPNNKADSIAGTALTAAVGAINIALFAFYSVIVGIKLDAQKILTLIESIIGAEQFASQFNSHGYYSSFSATTTTISTSDYGFIKDSVQSFDGMSVNNLYRNPYVIMKLNSTLPDPGITDNSLNILGSNGDCVNARISSNYAAIKVDFASQYGQIDSIRQIPISSCVYKITDTPLLFGGDTYINRYTEKNNYLFFNDWLIDQPENYTYNYLYYQNIIGTYYFVDNRKTYVGNSSTIADIFLNVQNTYRLRKNNGTTVGRNWGGDSGWKVDKASFYLFCNGVRDFFVESEVNVGYRDWEDEASKRFYDPYGYTDLVTLFRSDYVKFSAFYKYDYSLSVSRMYNQFVTWGQVLPRSFNPLVAATCYTYYPRRIQYSLPQQEELKRDNWQSFLVNNYKDMPTKVTSVKQINKTGALIMLDRQSPMQIMGVDSLQTDTGIKVTIGDGGLFNQPLQSLVNSDQIYEYGSCQSRWGITSTPYGVFYVSQDQGKIFAYTGQLEEISKSNMKWWFSRYLPLQLINYFPNFNLSDNPVIGAGITTVYDNINEVVYFSKRDYIPKRNDIQYDPAFGFYLNNGNINVNVEPLYTYDCPPGYQYINGQCQQVTTEPPVISTTNYSTEPLESVTYGTLGTALYDLGYNGSAVGTYTNIGQLNNFWINDTGTSSDGPVNYLMIKTTATSGIPNDTITYNIYLNNVPNEKIYYVAICSYSVNPTTAYTNFRITLNGQVILDPDLAAMNADSRLPGSSGDDVSNTYLHIYPIQITEVNNTLKLEGSYEGFGAALIDNTQFEILNATSFSDLNVIFTTNDKSEFIDYEYTCSGAGVLEYTYGVEEPVCVYTLTESLEYNTEILPPVSVFSKIPISLCDPAYFEDASWTISYDVKNKQWISFHDWHPTFMLPSKRHFYTAYKTCFQTQTGLWRHNDRWDDFCNFYGTYHPFEIEYAFPTGTTVTTMRNVEYYLEAYKYSANGQDKFHLLDYNFDSAIVYNSEQISGLLNLNLKSKSNPFQYLNYPIINPTGSTEILFSKEEQKYRFNQFNDITKDRGEFSGVENILITTFPNGYNWFVNPFSVDYYKSSTQKKKFRHNVSKVLLRKNPPEIRKEGVDGRGDIKMIFKFINTKLQISQK
jgi:hypothetical protein